jgi:hypothetical protein
MSILNGSSTSTRIDEFIVNLVLLGEANTALYFDGALLLLVLFTFGGDCVHRRLLNEELLHRMFTVINDRYVLCKNYEYLHEKAFIYIQKLENLQIFSYSKDNLQN